MFDPNHPTVQALVRLTDGKPVRAVRDSCSQGGPDGYVLYGTGQPLCGHMHFDEAKAVADAVNLILEGAAAKPAARD